MPFASKNPAVAGRQPAVTITQPDLGLMRFTQTCVVADSAANNVGVIGVLPAGYVPVMASVDTTTGLGGSAAISVGLLDPATSDISVLAADGGAAWLTAVAVGTAGVTQATASLPMVKTKSAATDRQIAVKFTAAGSTAGDLTLTLFYRAAP